MSFTVSSSVVYVQAQNNQFISPGILEYQFNNVSNWFANISNRLIQIETFYRTMVTNDPGQEKRRLNALAIIDNIRAQLTNSNYYATQQGFAPWLHAKRLETQLNSFGLTFVPGIWRVTRCGSGIFWHYCGRLDGNG